MSRLVREAQKKDLIMLLSLQEFRNKHLLNVLFLEYFEIFWNIFERFANILEVRRLIVDIGEVLIC